MVDVKVINYLEHDGISGKLLKFLESPHATTDVLFIEKKLMFSLFKKNGFIYFYFYYTWVDILGLSAKSPKELHTIEVLYFGNKCLPLKNIITNIHL